jgi:hypothetical protein
MKSQNSTYLGIKVFLTGSGSTPLTNVSGSGSRRPKNIRIRIRKYYRQAVLRIRRLAALLCGSGPVFLRYCESGKKIIFLRLKKRNTVFAYWIFYVFNFKNVNKTCLVEGFFDHLHVLVPS